MFKCYRHKVVHLLLLRIVNAGNNLKNTHIMQQNIQFCSDWGPCSYCPEKAEAVWKIYFQSAIFEKY